MSEPAPDILEEVIAAIEPLDEELRVRVSSALAQHGDLGGIGTLAARLADVDERPVRGESVTAALHRVARDVLHDGYRRAAHGPRGRLERQREQCGPRAKTTWPLGA